MKSTALKSIAECLLPIGAISALLVFMNSGKHLSRDGKELLGLLTVVAIISIVGAIALFILARVKRAKEEEQYLKEHIVSTICPSCHSNVVDKCTLCPKCGNDLKK